jgi:uncharacterized protein
VTAIIDVDAHFEPGGDWLAALPEARREASEARPGAARGGRDRGRPAARRARGAAPAAPSCCPPGLLTLFGNEKLAEADRRAEFEGKSQFQVANAKARVRGSTSRASRCRT